MDNKLSSLANRYRNNRGSDQSVRDAIVELYQHYVKKREQALIDAAAAATAVSALFLRSCLKTLEVSGI